MPVSDARPDESQRLLELYRTGILDTPPEQEFNDIVRMLSLVFDTPHAAITLVDQSRQWFKALEGDLDVRETPRNESICTYTVSGNDILVVTDTRADPRFSGIPLVVDKPHIRFYAGVPLRLSSGANIGALCALGTQPTEITAYQREMLTLLGRQTVKLIEQRERQQIHSWLVTLFERCDLLVCLLNLDAGALAYTNSKWNQRCTVREHDPLGMLQTLLPEANAVQLLGLVEKSSDQTLRWNNTRVLFSEDDTSVANVQLIPDSADTSARSHRKLLIVIDDQTDIHRARKEASEASFKASMLEKVATITRNPVIITNALGEIEWVNPAFEDHTGYALADVLGRRPGSFLQGRETAPEAVARIAEHLRAGIGLRQEILNYASDGREYWLELDIQPVHDQSDTLTHYIAVQTDITQRKQEEQAMREAHAESERISQIKTRFLGNVSHEIRTPLNGILGIAQYLSRKVPEQFREDINVLYRSGEHLLNLLNEMIDLSALEADILELHSQPFKPAQVMQEVFSLFEVSATAKGLDLKLEVDHALADHWASGDAKRLRQVLMNLVGNAIKFTSEGCVTLACTVASADDGRLALNFLVSDTGPGIEQKDRQHIFRRFSHSDAPEAGAGLGLSISRHILRRMRSRLTLESTVGEGSRFTFDIDLPLAEPVPDDEERVARLLEDADFSDTGPILVLDDNQTNLYVMRGLLESLGAVDVRLASSPREALKRSDINDIAIAFVDIRMPEMDGFEFLELFRQQTKANLIQPAAIACTALNGEVERETIARCGFDGYVGKPVTLTALAGLLHDRRELTKNSLSASEANTETSVITASLKEKMGDNMNLINHFLELMVEHNESYWQTIRQATAANDIETIIRNIHTIKGHLAYFGEEHPVYRKALEIDQALKDQPSIPLQDMVEFNQIMDELVDNISRHLAKQEADPAAWEAEK